MIDFWNSEVSQYLCSTQAGLVAGSCWKLPDCKVKEAMFSALL